MTYVERCVILLLALATSLVSADVQAQTCSISTPENCAPPTVWPAAEAFTSVQCLNPDVVNSFDACGDSGGNADHRDIVGGADDPAFQTASDGVYLFFRLRVNSDPRQGTGFRPFGWGIGLDSDGDGAYELYIALDGVGSRVILRNQDVLPGNTALLPSTTLTPVRTDGSPTWARADGPLADLCLNGSGDWHITIAVPLRLILEYGALGSLIAYAGSSSNSTGIGNDIVCFDGTPPSCSTGADCPSGVCLASTGTCGPSVVPGFLGCIDDSADAIDTGCSVSAPHCVVPDGLEFGECFPCATDIHCADSNECTLDSCTAGVCSNEAVASGTSCSDGVCSGASAECVECVSGAQCVAPTPICDTSSSTCVGCVGDADCGGSTPFCSPTAQTCVECFEGAQCSDSNECTQDLCTAGSCSNPPLGAGAPCSGDGVCDGVSACVACVDDLHCGGGLFCVANLCVSCRDEDDCADGNECTTHACTAGACSTSPRPFGDSCTGGVCSASSMCVPVAVDVTTPGDGSTVATSTPTLVGTATPGATVSIFVDGMLVGTVVADPVTGAWELPLSDPLDDGDHTATASVSLGGTSVMDSSTFTVDTTTTVAITSPEEGGTTLDSTPTIRGTGEPGATIVVTVSREGAEDIVIGPVTVDADGNWSATVPDPIPNGTYTATAVAVDGVGNTATDSATFDIDSNTDVTLDSPADGSTTSDTRPTVRGTAAPGSVVEVVLEVEGDEDIVIGTATADADGNWELPWPESEESLADGSHTLTATATDPAGNRGADSATFVVDTSTAVTIETVDPSTGVITGTGEPGSTVVVTIDGEEVGTTTVGEDGTWQVDAGPLSPGRREIEATATDAAGNSATARRVIDVESPMVDAGPMPTDGGALGDGGVAADAGPTRGGLAGGALCATSAPGKGGDLPLMLVALFGLALGLRRRRR